ncbi:hypothetical protein QBC35DRAFT_374164 [Podospora australis]|uniref:Uncharacterized protein n=1 Tax=Podospora australis TaxID=1536484 RepID=A0AAN6X221_9PEZI|nr:hypothetical protein QBC35DRAFT_374164 [Podospora australis]
MASSAVATPLANGVAALSRADSPASVNSSTKRKRDASDNDGESNSHDDKASKPSVNGLQTCQDPQSLIRDFFNVLQSLDTTTAASILERPLPQPESLPSDGEPSPKRAKSEDVDSKSITTIASKVSQGVYRILDDLMCDLVKTAKSQIESFEASDRAANEPIITKITAFKNKALELYKRELAYPNIPRPAPVKSAPFPDTAGGLVLTAVGAAPTLRSLYTSLQHTSSSEDGSNSILPASLPNGVSVTRILPEIAATGDKSGRSLTLGELFPSPRNLPPLQPPKAPKNTTKSNVLTVYHPELTDKSKYRSGTYFSQNLSTGNWLDYSNATPAIHAKTKQRERAQSLAGVKPSSTELEVSEMEALFRGAFSSFAPSKDDSGAIVPSGQISRMWWQRVGRRNFEKLIDAHDTEVSEVEKNPEVVGDAGISMDIDEDLVKEAVQSWDEQAVDPSLDQVLGKKSDHDKEVDDLLEEVSDLIETLASFQRNRNLTVPTSQDRYSADPNNGDMMRGGGLSQQPTEEETLTYQALKAQLSLIIQTLPPYAVARLNSDKLEELAVSTKIEVRSDEYRGVMEEDEPARLARQAVQAAASANQRQAHRTPSVSSASYGNHQYQPQFTPSARPIGNAQHFPQTPVRPQGPNMFPRPPSTVPIPQPHHPVQPRQPPPTQYRPQMYAPQLAKAQGPYGHSNMPQQYVAASPTQPRMQPHTNFMGQPGGPAPRYPQGYPAGYQQQQQQPQPQPIHPQHPPQSPHPHPQQPPHHPQQHVPQHPQQHPQQHAPQHFPQHPPQQHPQHLPQHQQQAYPPHVNGQMPRTMSPQVPQQAHPYQQSPTPPQQHQQIPRPPYGSPGMQHNPMQRQQYPGSPGPGMVPGGRGSLTGFATVMPEVQQRQVMEQARARAEVEQRVSGHMGKMTQGEVVGLAGIGLGGHVDVHKVAAAKMQMGHNGVAPSPSPKIPMHHGGPTPTPPINGTQTPVPIPHMGGAPSPAHVTKPSA